MIRPPLEEIITLEITGDQACALMATMDAAYIENERWEHEHEYEENTARTAVTEMQEQLRELREMLGNILRKLYEGKYDNGEKRGTDA